MCRRLQRESPQGKKAQTELRDGSEMLNNDKITITLVIASIIWNSYTSCIHGYPGWFTFILNVMLYYLAPMIFFGIYTLIKDLRQTGGINDAKTPLKV